MSVEKFRRLLKTLVTEYFYKSDLYFMFKYEMKFYKSSDLSEPSMNDLKEIIKEGF
jgi:hypothetical protein